METLLKTWPSSNLNKKNRPSQVSISEKYYMEFWDPTSRKYDGVTSLMVC